MSLNTLESAHGAKKAKRRPGRGLGRKGTTAGRGQKGQKSRSGVGGLKRLGMRKLILATPKLRGFRSLSGKAATVNLGDIAAKYIAGEAVTPKTLAKKGLIASAAMPVKVLAKGDLGVAVTVKGCEVSESAKAKIASAGGKVE
ncbi:50S ribosomal protein L15 [Candidatus Uhrbacteria bacterium]|nr:50S ribosomal protein L15 [Candidatus Uhrbacteria bacterium]